MVTRPSSIALVAAAVALAAVPVGELAAQRQPPSQPPPPQPPPEARPGNDRDIFDSRITDSYFFGHLFRYAPDIAAEAYASALSFASCAARLNRRAAHAVLDADAGSVEEEQAMIKLVRRLRTCIVSRSSVPTMYMRAALAEALAKQVGVHPNARRRGTVGITDVRWNVVPIETGLVLGDVYVGRFIKMKPAGETRIRVSGYPIFWIARCQVMTLPAQVEKVLAARPGTLQEKAAATDLYARSRFCGVEGKLGKTPVLAVRSSLADALYRRMQAGPRS